ncbi:MAG: hypothetical protein WBD28_00230 [Candidatus Zixiibacteriota bacterium]
MIKLYDKNTNKFLGEISDDELQFLRDNMEEEDLADVDYYISKTIFNLLKEKGMSENLTKIIEQAMGKKDEIEIRYEKV